MLFYNFGYRQVHSYAARGPGAKIRENIPVVPTVNDFEPVRSVFRMQVKSEILRILHL
jgi:hypothetical protein